MEFETSSAELRDLADAMDGADAVARGDVRYLDPGGTSAEESSRSSLRVVGEVDDMPVVTVLRLPLDVYRRLCDVAEAQGTHPGALAREWIGQRLAAMGE